VSFSVSRELYVDRNIEVLQPVVRNQCGVSELSMEAPPSLLIHEPLPHLTCHVSSITNMPEPSGEDASLSKSQSFNMKLPASCDPPSDMNPPKEAVWIV
jgi:hypothetical protein